jgi:hypothetical protein
VGVRKREYIPRYTSRDGVRRHVWIFGDDPTAVYPWPGLLVEWHRRPDGWWGRVVFVSYPSVPGEFACEWIPARALKPTPELPPTSP